MPNVVAVLDDNRFREIKGEALLACNLWLTLNLACERGDRDAALRACEQIAILTRSTLALVKRLGEAEPDTPFARDAKAWRAERDKEERHG